MKSIVTGTAVAFLLLSMFVPSVSAAGTDHARAEFEQAVARDAASGATNQFSVSTGARHCTTFEIPYWECPSTGDCTLVYKTVVVCSNGDDS